MKVRLNTSRKNMKSKIFLDCGFYAGKALEYYAPFLDDSWQVYVFEPNEELDVEESIKKFPFKIEWVKKAVWIKDEKVKLNTGIRLDASYIDKKGKDIQGLDFSKFVAELPEGTVVCSMDIEGSEYPVLRKMIKDKTIQRIDLLDIEFHDRIEFHNCLEKRETLESSSLLRIEIESLGVLVKLKI
jgi:FkbM family methyltransferase